MNKEKDGIAITTNGTCDTDIPLRLIHMVATHYKYLSIK
jgi:hypothetical protein